MEPKEIKDKLEELTKETAKQMQSPTEPSLFDFLHTKGVAIAIISLSKWSARIRLRHSDGGWHERNRRIVENCLDAAAGAAASSSSTEPVTFHSCSASWQREELPPRSQPTLCSRRHGERAAVRDCTLATQS